MNMGRQLHWNKEKCQEIALLYNNRTDFWKNSSSAYKKCRENNWLEEVCSLIKQLTYSF